MQYNKKGNDNREVGGAPMLKEKYWGDEMFEPIRNFHRQAREEQVQQKKKKKKKKNKKRKASSDEDDDDEDYDEDSGFISALQMKKLYKRQPAEKAGDESKCLPEAAKATSNDADSKVGGAPMLKEKYWGDEIFEARAKVAPLFREGHLGNDL